MRLYLSHHTLDTIHYIAIRVSVKKLSIEPGCITCGMCEFIAPNVFEVTDVSHIKPDFDQAENNDLIEQSVKECPVFVIKYEEQK